MNFSKEDIENLKEKISEAEEENEQTFEYRDQEFDVNYARYLVQYLKTQLGQTMPPNSKDHILPEDATDLVVDWYYGAREFPKETDICDNCEGSGCDECYDGLLMDIPDAKVFGTGDIQCPSCSVVHGTPPSMEITEGVLRCQMCGDMSYVSKDLAQKARNIQS